MVFYVTFRFKYILLRYVPFKLPGIESAVGFFHVVNFLLRFGSPEIRFAVQCPVLAALQPFTDQKVLPQCADVCTQLQRTEVFENGISDSIVVKIYLSVTGNFIPQVSAEWHQSENDVRFFHQIEIV
ncbi:MAG UNVERIFIED_CONTAM: hypothetical protein LVR29_14935 [Microcystis novacekii LVE1205-3]